MSVIQASIHAVMCVLMTKLVTHHKLQNQITSSFNGCPNVFFLAYDFFILKKSLNKLINF